MIPALISQSKGIAIFDDGNRLVLLDARHLEDISFPNEFGISQVLMEATDVESIQVTDLNALKSHLVLRREREEFLHAVLVLIDGDRPSSLRTLAGATIGEHFRTDLWNWVEGVLLSAPLPVQADVVGAARQAKVLSAVLGELESCQPQVSLLAKAWSLASDDQALRSETVRRGLWRTLVRGAEVGVGNPFATTLRRYSSWLYQQADKGLDARRWGTCALEERNPRVPLTLKEMDLFAAYPWRAAWAASHWPEYSWRCRRSEAFYFEPLAELNASLQHMSEMWTARSRQSEIVSIVDTLRALSRADIGSREPRDPWVIPVFVSASISASLSTYYADDPVALTRLLFCCSGADARLAIGETGVSDLVCGSAEMGSLVGIDVPPAIRCSYPSEDPGIKRWQTAALRETANKVRSALRLWCLGEMLEKNGSILLVFAPQRSRIGERAHFINPRTHSAREFVGDDARVVRMLQDRVVADVESGLAVDRCGWLLVQSIATTMNQGLESIKATIAQCKLGIVKAGLSEELIESDHDFVRLNPSLIAVPADSDKEA